VPFETIVRYRAERGQYGTGDPEEKVREVLERARRMEPHVFEHQRPNGEAVEVRGLPLPDGGFITIYTDISERKHSERELRRFRLAMEASVDSIYLTDPDSMKFVDVNAAACSRLGYPRERLLKMGPQDVLGKDRAVIRREYDDVIAAGERGMSYESRFVRSDGGERWTEIHRRALYVNDAWLIVTVGRDITERKIAETALQKATEQLERLALHDPLTGLANRRKFAERFEYDMARATRARTPLSLLMVDIDHFKEINDQRGHLAGDACLKALAVLLAESVRAVDLVARFGGEEFVVLLPEMSAEQSLVAAERIRSLVEAHSAEISEGAPVAVTVSIGAATSTGVALSLEKLLERADEAVYRAKRAGRNRACAWVAGG
jgi:diguanylate cyclase (GGDEF)-like protein/PAS domain S-box-containing protein